MQASNPVLTPGTPCFPRQMTLTPHTPTAVTYQNLTVWSLSCMEYDIFCIGSFGYWVRTFQLFDAEISPSSTCPGHSTASCHVQTRPRRHRCSWTIWTPTFGWFSTREYSSLSSQKFQLKLIINLVHDFGFHCNYVWPICFMYNWLYMSAN